MACGHIGIGDTQQVCDSSYDWFINNRGYAACVCKHAAKINEEYLPLRIYDENTPFN